jgi:urea transporter/murein DD-endopeptidase MepM/ murein hydrolase activator NlpD
VAVGTPPRSPAGWVAAALLRSYGQILFSRNLLAGALVAAVLALVPGLFLLTLLAIAVAALAAWLFGLGGDAIREGGPGCIAVLTTLALALFDPGGGSPVVLVVLGAVFSVLFLASFQAMFASLSLPTHALPFVAATWVVHLAARLMPAGTSFAEFVHPWAFLPPWVHSTSPLDLPAILLFQHGTLAGLLVLLALAVHSRISLVLAVLGAVVALGTQRWLRPGLPSSDADLTAAFNAMLAAMAMGGVWFVPQPSAIALAAVAALLASVTSYALFPLLATFSLPVISLPFVLVVLLLLTAARMRQHDRRPRSTIPGANPEQALAAHLVHMRRFGNLPWLPFRLPFRGEWFVSQGHDGEHTHQGLWRHGLDFEGVAAGGKPYQGEGKELRDFVCYGLPVVAAGSGTVALVEDGIPDNRIGEINPQDNWGNAVVLAHGPALFSVYAHLQPKSLRVKVGDVVTPGMELGRCGNSGRSPTPHLHFQIQRSKHLGSPTIAFEFGDVILRQADVWELGTHLVPKEGSTVRPVQRDDSLARALTFVPGTTYVLEANPGSRRELAEVEIDLRGRRYLRSPLGKLYFDAYDSALVLTGYAGSPSSLLRYLLLSSARVPFDSAAEIAWKDSLPRRLLLPGILRALADLSSVVVPTIGRIDVDYRLRRDAGRATLFGTSARWSAETTIDLGSGQQTIAIDHRAHRGARTTMTLRKLASDEKESA